MKKLVFDYDSSLTLDSLTGILKELYPEYPLKNKAKVLRLRKNAVSTVGIDVKEDFDNKLSIVQIYRKPSLGAQLFTGAIVQHTAESFVDEVALSLKTRLATHYHLKEETNKVKPRWTTRNRVGVGILIMMFVFIGTITASTVIDRNIHTLVYTISEDGHFSGDYQATKMRGGKDFTYIDPEGFNKTVRISKDSTYFYNQSDSAWLLYSVDYISNTSATIPDEIMVLIPAHTLTSSSKISSYISDYKPQQTENMTETDVQRGYKRRFFIQEYSEALDNLAAIYGE